MLALAPALGTQVIANPIGARTEENDETSRPAAGYGSRSSRGQSSAGVVRQEVDRQEVIPRPLVQRQVAQLTSGSAHGYSISISGLIAQGHSIRMSISNRTRGYSIRTSGRARACSIWTSNHARGYTIWTSGSARSA